jgi:hypothetical protein
MAPSPVTTTDEKEAPAKRGCCGCSRAKEPDWGMLPNSKRKCRDVLCLAFFAVFCA